MSRMKRAANTQIYILYRGAVQRMLLLAVALTLGGIFFQLFGPVSSEDHQAAQLAAQRTELPVLAQVKKL